MTRDACRCASCIGESARAQWFRHSDGWQSGSSTFGSGASSSINTGYSGHKRESPWDSLPSLRHEDSLNDSGYKSNRTDSLEQRWGRQIPHAGPKLSNRRSSAAGSSKNLNTSPKDRFFDRVLLLVTRPQAGMAVSLAISNLKEGYKEIIIIKSRM